MLLLPRNAHLPLQQGIDMSSLQELLKQQQELNAKIEKARQDERNNALSNIKKIADEAGLSLDDIKTVFSGSTAKVKSGATRSPAPIKYRDDHGNVWSGRGAPPRWLVSTGKPKEFFLVKDQADSKQPKKDQPSLI
jgi:DNA-binding protein H-NS